MRDALDDFLARRWEEIQHLLYRWGFDLGGGLRDGEYQGYDPLVVVDPPTGTIRLKATTEVAPGCFASIRETWSTRKAAGTCQSREGLWETGYSYHFQAQDRAIRFDYDPEKHPELPYHFHPPHDPRTGQDKEWRDSPVVDLAAALSAGLSWFLGEEVGPGYIKQLRADIDHAIDSAPDPGAQPRHSPR